jgi:hypothetical protein
MLIVCLVGSNLRSESGTSHAQLGSQQQAWVYTLSHAMEVVKALLSKRVGARW